MPPKQYTSVPEFLGDLDPTLRPVLESVREVILAASPAVTEGIKWNCVSFATTEYFATLNIRPVRKQPCVLLVLHTGAKAKAVPAGGLAIPDPRGILEWVAADRATVHFTGAADFAEKRSALAAVIGAWIAQ